MGGIAPMAENPPAIVMDGAGLQSLLEALADRGYQVIGPQVADGAIVYQSLAAASDLPAGWIEQQDGGHYRLVESGDARRFAHVVGPHTWKRFLYPSLQRLWSATRQGQGFEISTEGEQPKYAFIGVRACELRAIGIHDKVFIDSGFTDAGYAERRRRNFLVAVNCARAGDTCFCASMGSGPDVGDGYDLALTEIGDADDPSYLVEAGSDAGADLQRMLPGRPAGADDLSAAADAVAAAARSMGREMVADAGPLLKRHLEHRQWDAVAERCLNCTNCTMVCPTCFCSTVEDVTDLSGMETERIRKWDSCFTLDFSYIHGGAVRREGGSRYRQWMTHKLAYWWDQFGESGCVGCGRCITWCPVGIDITEEARAIAASETAGQGED